MEKEINGRIAIVWNKLWSLKFILKNNYPISYKREIPTKFLQSTYFVYKRNSYEIFKGDFEIILLKTLKNINKISGRL